MTNIVEVSLKDGGHSLKVNGEVLRGSKTLLCEETDHIKQLRKAGLIATKKVENAVLPKTVIEKKVEEAEEDGLKEQSEKPPIQNHHNRPGNRNNRNNRNTMQT